MGYERFHCRVQVWCSSTRVGLQVSLPNLTPIVVLITETKGPVHGAETWKKNIKYHCVQKEQAVDHSHYDPLGTRKF